MFKKNQFILTGFVLCTFQRYCWFEILRDVSRALVTRGPAKEGPGGRHMMGLPALARLLLLQRHSLLARLASAPSSTTGRSPPLAKQPLWGMPLVWQRSLPSRCRRTKGLRGVRRRRPPRHPPLRLRAAAVSTPSRPPWPPPQPAVLPDVWAAAPAHAPRGRPRNHHNTHNRHRN